MSGDWMNVKGGAVTVGLEVAGLVAICAAGYALGVVFWWAWLWVGLLLTGAGCLALSWMLGPDETA